MAVWAAFWALGLIWGSSFLLIKIGIGAFQPLQLVMIRVGVAAAAMVVTLLLTRQRFPAAWTTRRDIVIVGLINTALPFFLITWGEQHIDSGLATVLNATVPLFSLVIAHFALQDERITAMKVLGLFAGFVGVVVLVSRAAQPVSGEGGAVGGSPLLGQLAVLGAALCYGIGTVYARRKLRHVQPMVISGGVLLTSTLATGAGALLFEGVPQFADVPMGTLLAVLVLGLLNTWIAYLLFYWIIDHWGATRATLVTYIMPPVGLTLGALARQELVDARLLFGAGLIFVGVVLVNWRRSRTGGAAPTPAAVQLSSRAK